MNARIACRYADRVKELSKRKANGPADCVPFPDDTSFGQSARLVADEDDDDEDGTGGPGGNRGGGSGGGGDDYGDEPVGGGGGGVGGAAGGGNLHDVDDEDGEDDAKAVGMAPDQLNYSIIVTKMIKSEAMLLLAHQQAFEQQVSCVRTRLLLLLLLLAVVVVGLMTG